MAVKYPHLPGFYQPLGESAVPYAPGNFTVWEYVDARDAAAAFRLAIERSELGLFERAFIATDRTSRESHRDLVRLHYPHLAAAADEMGPDDLILTIRRARQRLGYAPRHSWRGPEANARVR
jgi:nucleoside-diphosphate-sugar epimerase